MTKGKLQKFIDKRFDGSAMSAANEMVVLFCKKYGIPGSAGYDFYTPIQKVWEEQLQREKDINKMWKEYGKQPWN